MNLLTEVVDGNILVINSSEYSCSFAEQLEAIYIAITSAKDKGIQFVYDLSTTIKYTSQQALAKWDAPRLGW